MIQSCAISLIALLATVDALRLGYGHISKTQNSKLTRSTGRHRMTVRTDEINKWIVAQGTDVWPVFTVELIRVLQSRHCGFGIREDSYCSYKKLTT